ncbi:MAG: hypothetical protein WCI73_02135, partial [Phycisphaerae bacterium]
FLGEQGSEEPSTLPNRRFLARKFYGTFVLAQQSAASLAKAGAKMPPSLRSSAEEMQSSMVETARRALATARRLDPEVVSQLCSRPNAPSCGG